jgi:hypothetical protein
MTDPMASDRGGYRVGHTGNAFAGCTPKTEVQPLRLNVCDKKRTERKSLLFILNFFVIPLSTHIHLRYSYIVTLVYVYSTRGDSHVNTYIRYYIVCSFHVFMGV